jgi:hypothetical protein
MIFIVQVVLGPNVQLQPFMKITKVKQDPGYSSDLESFDPGKIFKISTIKIFIEPQ